MHFLDLPHAAGTSNLTSALDRVQGMYQISWEAAGQIVEHLSRHLDLEFKSLPQFDYLHRPDADPREWLPGESWWFYRPLFSGEEAATWRHNPVLGFLGLYAHPTRKHCEPLLAPFVAHLEDRSLREIEPFSARQLFLQATGDHTTEVPVEVNNNRQMMRIDYRGEGDGQGHFPRMDLLFLRLEDLLRGTARPEAVVPSLAFLLRNNWDECLMHLPRTSVFPEGLLQ